MCVGRGRSGRQTENIRCLRKTSTRPSVIQRLRMQDPSTRVLTVKNRSSRSITPLDSPGCRAQRFLGKRLETLPLLGLPRQLGVLRHANLCRGDLHQLVCLFPPVTMRRKSRNRRLCISCRDSTCMWNSNQSPESATYLYDSAISCTFTFCRLDS